VSFTTSATAANKVTGGTGNDTVTLGAALDKNDVIALGDGTADTLVTSMTFNTTNAVTGAYYSDTIAAADLPTISGVEVARINLVLDATPAAGTGAMSAKTASFASTVEINGAAAVDIGNVDITINNIAAGQKVKIGSNLDLDSGKVIFVLADATGTADSLAISTDGKNATATSTFGEEFVNKISIDAEANMLFQDAANNTLATLYQAGSGFELASGSFIGDLTGTASFAYTASYASSTSIPGTIVASGSSPITAAINFIAGATKTDASPTPTVTVNIAALGGKILGQTCFVTIGVTGSAAGDLVTVAGLAGPNLTFNSQNPNTDFY
jgi:hypothetical protein